MPSGGAPCVPQQWNSAGIDCIGMRMDDIPLSPKGVENNTDDNCDGGATYRLPQGQEQVNEQCGQEGSVDVQSKRALPGMHTTSTIFFSCEGSGNALYGKMIALTEYYLEISQLVDDSDHVRLHLRNDVKLIPTGAAPGVPSMATHPNVRCRIK
mmetsp:Transcript_22925/g.40910  ORF Transcript_22925/g.40910 Transcript_22925/m.40910 type:complete len:154 (-) Transcript_22925:38-499(-)